MLLGKLDEAYYMVALRINTEEKLAGELQKSMIKLSKMVNSNSVEFDDLDQAQVRFLENSNRLIKAEWKRVKQGEPVFRKTTIFAGALIVACAGLVFFLALRTIEPQPTTVSAQKMPDIVGLNSASKFVEPKNDKDATPISKNKADQTLRKAE